MKILYVITSTETGGAEKALSALSLEMVQQGHTVRVLCLKPLGPVAEQMRQNNIEVKTLHSKLPGRAVRKIKAEIESFRPDIGDRCAFCGGIFFYGAVFSPTSGIPAR